LKLTNILVVTAIAIALAACTAAPPPPPLVTPEGEDRFLVDPRLGFSGTMPPPVATRFETAWRFALNGDEAAAQRELAEIQKRSPDLVPALLLEAYLDIRAKRYDDAQARIDRVRSSDAENLAARVYEAEIAVRKLQTRLAYDLYRQIAPLPGAPPTATDRIRELESVLFNDLYTAAQSAPPAESIRLLREALALNSGAVDARILLTRTLIAQKQHEEARRELEPLLNTAPDRVEVQEVLAEVDIGRGRFPEAIVRYERLARRTKDPRYEQRLEEIKAEWSAQNMPSHYRAALESTALTREDLAVLLYWTVPSVRFAQNLSTPQIAVDVEGLAGREEIIRAIALGLFDVDPVTRRVGPYRTVSAGRFAQHLARVLTLRGATCARGVAQDKVLAACGVEDITVKVAPEAPIAGRDAQRLLEQVAKKL
jgi:tetratricopeptide (TPR) repeat protein